MVFDTETIMKGGDRRDSTALALFIVGFTSSVLSASLGMTRLLMNGPSKLIKKQGSLGGYLQCGFAMLFISVMCMVVAKALWLGLAVVDFKMGMLHGHKVLKPNKGYVLVWLGVSILPQLILVSYNFQRTMYNNGLPLVNLFSGVVTSNLSMWIQQNH